MRGQTGLFGPFFMFSFQTQYTQFQDMSQDNTAASLVIGKRNINMGQKILESEIGYPPEEDTRTFTTTTTDTYNLPENYIRLIELYVTVGTTRYLAEQIYDERSWQMFKRRTSGLSSDYLKNCFIRQKTFEIYPTPSVGTYTMTMIYEALSKDMVNADYVTGTVTTLAAAGTVITGSGTVWTSAMIGRYVKIDSDGQFYRVTARSADTGITIANPYQGIAISGGSEAYTIGEIPRTPPATHIIPVYFALWKHFEGVRRDAKMGLYYKGLFEQNTQWAKATFGNRYSSQVIPSMRYLRRRSILNPNWYPESIS